MPKKLLLAASASVLMALTMTSIASAAPAQVNKYGVTGTITGGKKATKKAPKPIQLKFAYTVDEESGFRPSVVTKYSINFGGLQVNTSAFPGCAASVVSPTGPGPSSCPKKSLVGTGTVHNATGSSDDPTERNPGLLCNLRLTTVNSTKKNHMWLYLFGQKDNPDIEARCALPVNQAIDATFKKTKTGTSLTFGVPDLLLHPINGLDNSVILVGSTIKKVTAKKGGKTLGYFESTGCNAKTNIFVDFTQEVGGLTKRATNSATCK